MTRILLCLLLGMLAACSSTPAPRLPLAQEQAVTADQNARRALREGQLLRAQNGFAAALALQQSLDDTQTAAMTMINLATVDHLLGDDTTALTLLDNILQEKTTIYPDEAHRIAAFRKSVILADLSRLDAAESAWQSADALCGKSCSQRLGLDVLRARLLLQKGDAEGALAQAQAVRGGSSASREEQANLLRLIAAAEEKLARHDDALQHYSAALELDKALGLSSRIGEDLAGLARVSEKTGRREAAAEYDRRASLVKESQRQLGVSGRQ